MILRRGSTGADVELLQIKLKAAGYDPGDVDGDFGKRTYDAVLAFQGARPDIEDDGVAGPMTMGALDAAIAKRRPANLMRAQPHVVPCNDETWTAFEKLIDLVTTLPVQYGPGRGLWDKATNKFVITHGPGALDSKVWKNVLGRSYPSFHCSSWTNFFLGWLLRYNEEYTHAGNIPNLFDLLEQDAALRQNPGAGPYRGYGDHCSPIPTDGSTLGRTRVAKVLDIQELYDRRASLPTFVVCGQSTKRADGSYLWWHHTLLFAARDGKLFRIAADGYRSAQRGYSAQPMRWVEITPANLRNYSAAIYRCYGVDTADGSYGDKSRSIADVRIES